MTKILHDHIKGALYGVAIGDALGGPLEFMSAEEIQKKHGRVTEMIGGGWLDLEPGETTDDTAMTLCVAEGILADPDLPIHEIGDRFIEWYLGGPKDVGNACASSIQNAISNGGNWQEAARMTRRAHGGMPVEGNGALMRTIYPALFYRSRTKRKFYTRAIAEMTHAGSQSTHLCIEYVEAVHAAILGEGVSLHVTPDAEPTGYVVDTFNVAVEAILQTRSFEDAIVEAVNRGGDADTIGAICGGLAGAMYGYEEIPQRWIDSLHPLLRRDLDRFADAAYAQYE